MHIAIREKILIVEKKKCEIVLKGKFTPARYPGDLERFYSSSSILAVSLSREVQFRPASPLANARRIGSQAVPTALCK